MIVNLEEPEFLLLNYLAKNALRFESLNDLNHLFVNGNNSENFSSIVKRREITLVTLLQKISFITAIPEKELIINSKKKDKSSKK